MFADRPPTPGPHQAVDGCHTFRKLGRGEPVDPNALNITLFLGAHGEVRGWFIGPLAVVEGRAILPYLPQSAETHAAVAIVRALAVARSAGCPICVIDPDDLWDGVWRV